MGKLQGICVEILLQIAQIWIFLDHACGYVDSGFIMFISQQTWIYGDMREYISVPLMHLSYSQV